MFVGQFRFFKIQIVGFFVDLDIGFVIEKFEEVFKSGDFVGICELQIEFVKMEEEKVEWQVLKILSVLDGCIKIVEYFGYFKEEEEEFNGVEEFEIVEIIEVKEEIEEIGLVFF